MAKTPKFYPILPRVPRTKRNVVITKATEVQATYVMRRSADRIFKPTGFLERDQINDTHTVNTGLFSSKSFVNNANWQVNVAKGVDAGAGYFRSIVKLAPTDYTCTSESTAYKSIGHGKVDGGPLLLQNDTTALEDMALARLKHKLNGYIGNAQLAAPIAESREIGRLVRQINALGMETLRNVLAIKKTRGKSLAKGFGDIWLGFGFGVNPLLKDIQKAADSILHYTTRMDRRVRVTGTASREYTSGHNPGGLAETIAFGLGIGFARLAVHRQSIQIVAGVDLTIRSAASYSVSDHLGLKITDVPATLWELVPFSWVVDYVATVGPWLEDMFYTVPGTVKYVYQSKKYQNETRISPFPVWSAGFSGSLSAQATTAKYVSFTRTKLSTLPTRALRLKTADEFANHGLTKFLNLASVVAGRSGPKWRSN